MPTCLVTLSEVADDLSDGQINLIRDTVAQELTSGARFLTDEHISLRIMRSRRAYMLGEVEVEVQAQFFLRRFWNRDKRAQQISARLARTLGLTCATWINLSVVGYARVTPDGVAYFSDKASGRPPSKGHLRRG